MKTLSLIVAISLATGTGALAQQTNVRGNSSAEAETSVSADRHGSNIASDMEMNATLERSVDARRAKPGDEVTAKMNEDFTTQSGVTIPRGSRLVGRVTEARPHARGEGTADGTASQLGVVFDKALLKDGREVPMQATIQALAASRSSAQGEIASGSHDVGAFGSSHTSGGGLAGGSIGGLGGAGGGVVGSATGTAGAAVGGATRLPRSGGNAAAGGAGAASAHGGALLGSSAGAVGGLGASGRWLAGSRGVFGIGDLSIASAAAGSARGSLITSASRNVRLDGGTQLLLTGSAVAAGR